MWHRPAPSRAPGGPSAAWPADPGGSRVLVSLGTTYQRRERLLRRLVAVVAGLPVRTLVTGARRSSQRVPARAPERRLRAAIGRVLIDGVQHKAARRLAGFLAEERERDATLSELEGLAVSAPR